ncbi:unnamed protein product [Rhizophagus irregularis]|nr:unnamed protein product [Rhizophagus irregularis]
MDNEIDEIAWPEETNNASENQLSGYNKSDTDGEIVNVNEVALTIGDLLESVQVIIDSYAKQNGFVVVKSRKDVDPIDKSIIRRREYICWKSGTHQSKKVEDISLHRECSSYKTNCLWQASFYLGKKSNLIRLTKFVQEHNHQCDPESIELAPKNLRLPQQIIDKIEHYTMAPEYEQFLHSELRLRNCQNVQKNFAQMYDISKKFFILYNKRLIFISKFS